MRIRVFRHVAVGAGALAMTSLACRLSAQQPNDVTVRAQVSQRAIPIDRGSAALWQSLLKLHTRASVLMIVAHPDDEDGGLLAYESRGQGARVGLLTLNRGEAGQNLMNSDYWEALGLDRTHELLAAGRRYGVNQSFTRVIDFGFSKSKEESMRKWTHQRVLADVVRVVRMVRPLVITSVFVGGHSDGHGQHQVSGQTAQEAFKDAGDPNMFPEQIREGLRPWKPLKDYARVPTFAIRDHQIWDYANDKTYPLRFEDYISGRWIEGMLPTSVVIPEGEYDPLLGGSFEQIARRGLGFQKTQNGGLTAPPPGPANAEYHRFGSRVPAAEHEASMFDGIDVSLAGIADLASDQDDAFLKEGLAKLSADVDRAMTHFDARHPEAIAPILAEGAKENLALIGQVEHSSLSAQARYDVLHELHVKEAQFNTALATSLGLTVNSTVEPPAASGGPFGFGPTSTFRVAIPGQTFDLSVRAANQGDTAVAIRRVQVLTPAGESWTVAPAEGASPPQSIAGGAVASQRFTVTVARDAAFTRPYFSIPDLEQPYYDLDRPADLPRPFAPYPVSGWVEFAYRGVPIRVGQVVQTMGRVIGYGDVGEPLVVAPAISLWIAPHAGVVPIGASSFPLSVRVHSNVKGPAKGTLRLDLPDGWHADPAVADFSLAKDGEDQTVDFRVSPAALRDTTYRVHAVASYDGRSYREGYETAGYPGLRPYNLYRAADYGVAGADVKTAPGLRVGYVTGTGDQVPQTLENLGIHVTFLSKDDITSGDLDGYDAIVVGERAYSVRPELATSNQRLLDYVRQGGDLIVQYQAGEYDHDYGPYPLKLGAAQTVTDEASAVQFLLPRSPALVWPNRIDASDFEGWIEERGHGFPESWDSHWEAPLEMHDPEQAPQKGGILVASYGKGVYAYVALALYHQMPEGVPGAYRILANLLSLGENPGLKR